MARNDATVYDEVVIRPGGVMESVFSHKAVTLAEGTQVQIMGNMTHPVMQYREGSFCFAVAELPEGLRYKVLSVP